MSASSDTHDGPPPYSADGGVRKAAGKPFTEQSLVADATAALLDKIIFPEIDRLLERASAAGNFSVTWIVSDRISSQPAAPAKYLIKLIYRRYEEGHPYRFVVQPKITSHCCAHSHLHLPSQCREQVPNSIVFEFCVNRVRQTKRNETSSRLQLVLHILHPSKLRTGLCSESRVFVFYWQLSI